MRQRLAALAGNHYARLAGDLRRAGPSRPIVRHFAVDAGARLQLWRPGNKKCAVGFHFLGGDLEQAKQTLHTRPFLLQFDHCYPVTVSCICFVNLATAASGSESMD